jgi:hypothetical protein
LRLENIWDYLAINVINAGYLFIAVLHNLVKVWVAYTEYINFG